MLRNLIHVSWMGIVALGLGLTAVNFVSAEDKPAEPKKEAPKRGEGRGRDRAQVFQDLGLSEDQMTKVKEVLAKNGEAMNKWREENKEKLDAISAKARAAREAQDEAAGKAAREEMTALMKNAPGYDLVALTKDILTPEQSEKLAKKIEEQRASRGGPGGPGKRGEKKGEKAPL